jgi:gliding motility-associated-like protein
MNKQILFVAFMLGFALQTTAQMANVTYTARTNNIKGYCAADCYEVTNQEYRAYVNSWDNINGTATGTGCQSADVTCDATYGVNFFLQTRTNASDVLFASLDAWEEDCGGDCSYNTGVFLCGDDDCRQTPTNSYNFRALSLPSNGTYTVGPTWGSTNNHEYSMQTTWKYTGTNNLITPTCANQTSAYSAGGVRSWSVNLVAGVSYNFNTCAGTSNDTYLRIYAADGFTLSISGDDNCGVLSSVDLVAPSSGTYYVEVAQYSHTSLTTAGILTYRINTPSTSTNGGNLSACQNVASASLNGLTPSVGTGTWTSSSGTVTFSNPNSPTSTATGTTAGTFTLIWTINNGGCTSASTLQFTVNSLSTPPSTITGTNTICAGASTVLTASGGSLGAGATVQWFTGSCGGTALSTGASVTVSPASTTTYFVRYGGTCNNTTCISQIVTVNTLSTNPTSATAAPTAFCAGSSSSLNVVGGTAGTGATYRWYSGSCGGAAVGTGASISVNPATTTNYFVRLEGTCNTTTCASTTLTVNPIPSAPVVPNVSVCVGQPQILTATGVGTINWYSVPTGGAIISTGATFDAGNPSAQPIGTYTYYATDFNGTCESTPRTAVLLTISAAPASPTASGVSICPNASATLSASGAGSGFNWYNSPIAASPLATGAIFVTPALSANTSYWVAAVNALGCAGTRTQVDVSILNVPTPTAASTAICPNSSAALSAAVAGAIGYRWYTNSDRTGFLFAGANFNTPILNTTTIYYVSALYSNGCESLLSPVTVTVNAAPPPPVSNGLSSCSNINTLLTASGAGGTLSWFNVSTGGTSLATGATFNAGVLAAGNYTFYVEESNGTCVSPRTAILVTVYNSPAAPTTTNTTICANSSAVLTATGAGVRWFADAALTNQVGAGNSFTTPILTSTSNYFAAIVNGNNCFSAALMATATVNPNPIIPTATGATICAGSTATVSATGASGTLNWFSDASAANLVGTGANFTTPILNSNNTYFVRETSAAGCFSPIAAATVTVNALPSAPTANAAAVCAGNSLIFNGFGAGGTLSWFNVATGGTSLATGATFNAGVLAAGNYTFYIQENNGFCNSNRTAVTSQVFASPAAPTTTNTTICANSSAVLTATGAGVRWFADAALTNQVGAGNSFTTPILTSTSNYFAAVVNGNNCFSAAVMATATVNPNPIIPIATGATICAGSTATVSATGASGTLNWFSDASAANLVGTGANFTTPILNSNNTYFVRETSAAGCFSPIAAATVTVNALPSAPTANAAAVCAGNSLIFNGFGAGGTLSWFNVATGGTSLATGATFNAGALPAGNYTFYIQENNGFCNSNRTAVIGVVNAAPNTTTVSSNSPICEGEDLILQASTSAGAVYTWSNSAGFSQTGQTIILTETTLAQAGNYSVSLSLGGCNSAAISTIVTINASPVLIGAISNNSPICETENLTLTAPTVTNASYAWAGPNGFTATGATININNVTENDQQGLFTVIATNNSTGCESNPLSTLVQINALPTAAFASNNSPLCVGSTLELTTQQIFGANYNWTGPNGYNSTDRNPLILNIDSTYAGTYNVVVAIGTCAVTLSTTAVINSAPAATIIADTSVRQGEVLQLFATGGTLFQWSPAFYLSDANSATPIFSGAPEGNYTYSVFITNALGCVLEKKVNIEVLPSLEPKFVDLFTPNNDGVNDTWEIGFLQNFSPYTLVVYSRGGLEVLRTENYANNWDGTKNGNALPDGTYWYVLRTQDREFSGAVTIKR